MFGALEKVDWWLRIAWAAVAFAVLAIPSAMVTTGLVGILFDFELAWIQFWPLVLQILPVWLLLFGLFMSAWIAFAKLFEKSAEAAHKALAAAQRDESTTQGSGPR